MDGQPKLSENLGDLVHEGDVDIALRVLDHLGGFGGLDRSRAEGAAGGDRAVDRGEAIGHPSVLDGGPLGAAVDGGVAVTWMYALGRVAGGDMNTALQSLQRTA